MVHPWILSLDYRSLSRSSYLFNSWYYRKIVHKSEPIMNPLIILSWLFLVSIKDRFTNAVAQKVIANIGRNKPCLYQDQY